MTHEEIEAAIERLEKLGSNGFVFDTDIVDAVNDSTDMFEVRNTIIDLLKQADPETYMEVPVDADGVPIHIGDTVWDGSGFEWKVDSIEVKCSKGNIVSGFFDADGLTHHPPVTVESVLEEYVERWHDTHHDDIPALTAEYAAKIREVMADDDHR